MIKKTIKYTDFDGNEREETFYFNLTKAECMEMELSTNGGLENVVRSIIEAKDSKMIVEIFKDLILKAYGEKSPDGKHFYKSPEISAKFASTEAYSELFMELSSDADAASKFFNGIVPQVPEDVKRAAEMKKSMIPG
jgi:hypothetical protein